MNIKFICNKFFIILFFIILSFCMSTNVKATGLNDFDVKININGNDDEQTAKLKTEGIDNSNNYSFFELVIKKYSEIIIGVFGLATLTSVIIFVKLFIQLGSVDNPMERKRTVNALLWAAISTAFLGGVLIYVFFSFNLLK